MEFKYRIYEEVYNDILSGKKTIEFRLLNAKSNNIQIGDKIKFIVVDNEEKYLLVKVIDKFIYDNLDKLWNSKEILSNALNYTKEEFIEKFKNIFGEDNVKKSKIVGFKIKNINYNL